MRFDSFNHLPYPQATDPQLDDTIRFLDILSLARVQTEGDDTINAHSLLRQQQLHEELLEQRTPFRYLAARDDEGIIRGAALYAHYRNFSTLDALAVEESHQDQRIGSQLLRIVIGEAKANDHDYLMLHATPGAYEFYLNHGFDDISNNDDECRYMALALKDDGSDDPEYTEETV